MSGPKRRESGEFPDLSHHPTRKVDGMSSLVAEMLLRDPDADATSPGLPAVTVVDAAPDASNESDAHDAVGLDMARLIEVQSSVVPPAAPPTTSPAEESAAIRAFRSRPLRRWVVVAAVLALAGLVVAAFVLSRSR